MDIKYHEEDENIILKYEMDAEPVIDHVKRKQEEISYFNKPSEFQYKMSIPMPLLMQIGKETGLDFFNKDDAKKIKQIIMRDYPKLCVRKH